MKLTNPRLTSIRALAVAVCALALSACGGGAETTENPASRNATSRVRQPAMMAIAPNTSSAITSGSSASGTPIESM